MIRRATITAPEWVAVAAESGLLTDAAFERKTIGMDVPITYPQNAGPATPVADCASLLSRARSAQQLWAGASVAARLAILKRARHLMAANAESFATDISSALARSHADTLAAEVLPLLGACEFLEREAQWILRPTKLGRRGLPLWLWGVSSEIQRAPLGVVLIIGAGNYPLLLAGAQALQALTAGNAVILKPGRDGRAIALRFASLLSEAGLPEGLLTVTDESPETAEAIIASGVDKVFLTGSAATGRAVMRQLAETLTPSVMELSGCDAVFVLDGARLDRVVEALAFGIRLNGSATCMAPRRVFAAPEVMEALQPKLLKALRALPAPPVPASTRRLLDHLIADAHSRGAVVLGNNAEMATAVVTRATPEMQAMQADIFAPILSLCTVKSEPAGGAVGAAVRAYNQCPYALTAAVFGPENHARALADQLEAGTVLVNDVIAPTIDPRVPFGGRRQSGFGTTRGAEGLLEMTAVRIAQTRRGDDRHHYAPSTPAHADFFAGYIHAAHGDSLRQRWRGLLRAIKAAIKIR